MLLISALYLSLVCGLALLICSPYLVYTYALTGKIFYWGNSGGLSLYWMSSPHPQEFGDWHNPQTLSEIPELETNHGALFREDERFRLVLLAATAFALGALLSAHARQFYILVPFLVPAAGFIFFKIVRITVSIENKS